MTGNHYFNDRRMVKVGPKPNWHPVTSVLFQEDKVECLFGPPQQEPLIDVLDFKNPGPRSLGDDALSVDAYQLWSPKDRLPYDKPTVQQVPLNDHGSHYTWMNSLPPRDGTSPEKRLPYDKPVLNQAPYDGVGRSPKWGAGHPLPQFLTKCYESYSNEFHT